MKNIAIAATATLAIVTIAGLTGTIAARAQIAKAVHVVEHPTSIREAINALPTQSLRLCAFRAGALDMPLDANGRPVYAPQAIAAQSCQ
jgi:hypothetical protein